ncbi:hypothetical protein BDV93DRAFT_612403, partial [Ceratobasidium sp. AG-I]
MAQPQLILHALGGAPHRSLRLPPSSTSGHVLSLSSVIPGSRILGSLQPLGFTVNYPDQARPATSSYGHVRFPPPTDQPIDAKFNRNILDGAQWSLDEPPIDEGGLPLWDEAFFKYNGPQRKREPKQQDSKLHFDYAPRQAPSVPSAASPSSSPPQTPASVPTLAQWFASSNSGRIVQNDDSDPETAGLNVGRPPAQYPQIPNQNLQQARIQTQNQARPAIQVQAGPRPHDVLSQPSSLVSDPEDDPLLLNGGSSGLS